MLVAVDNPNSNYENLNGYLANLVAPTAIRTTEPSVRQSLARPTDSVPGPKTKMPTSSARPGKGTNQRILYTRVQTVFDAKFGPVDDAPIEEGDVVFVHRGDGSTTRGHDTARTSRVASLAQLNRVLRAHGGQKDEEGELFMNSRHDPAGDQDDPPTSSDFAANRWKNCKFLANWVPDGVLVSKEREGTQFDSNPGAALNIAVGGPTLLRNSHTGAFSQHIDDGARTLDKLFVGLVFAKEKSADNPEEKIFTYQFRLFSSRQLLFAQLGGTSLPKHINANATGGDNRAGPSGGEFLNMVQIWRIGSILDTRAGSLGYKCLFVNVVLEEWTLDKINEEYSTSLRGLGSTPATSDPRPS